MDNDKLLNNFNKMLLNHNIIYKELKLSQEVQYT